MRTSNKFTTVRVVAAPVFFILYFLPLWLGQDPQGLLSVVSVLVCIPLLAFAEFTDFLDGHFARKHDEVSDFGKLYDPFADVFLHVSTFICFTVGGYCPAAVLVLIIYRELAQNFLRMVAAKKGTAIAARKGGKLKTVLYVTAGFFSLAQEALFRTGLSASVQGAMPVLRTVGLCLYVLCVVLAYVSFADYLARFGKILKEEM